MKIIVLLLNLILLSSNTFGQKIDENSLKSISIENFKIEDCKIKWVRVYELSSNVSGLRNQLLDKTQFNLKERNDSTLIGSFNDLSLIGSKCAYKDFVNDPMSGKVRVDIKDNKYRVTISDITFKSGTTGKILTLEWFGLNKKCEFKGVYGFTKYIGKILECFFSSEFELKEDNEALDNW